jgi:tetratricopeptide (TPR) repeat protein
MSFRKFDSQIQKNRAPFDPEKRQKQLELLKSAADHVLEGRVSEALPLLEEAIQIDPIRAAPWTWKAIAHGNEGRLSAALKAIDRALEIDPSDPEKWDVKASLLQKMGRLQET